MKTEKFNLSMKWYISRKPYDNYDDYDWYYLNLVKKVYGLLGGEGLKKHLGLTKVEVRELAFILVSYFEDIICEIGIWETIVKSHRKLYGKPLPLLPVREDKYMDGDLNTEDVLFLIWFFISSFKEDTLHAPNNYLLRVLSSDIAELFENEYEEAPAIDLYDDYFKIKDTDGYFEVRSKLQWMAFNSYIFGYELNKYYDSLMGEIFKDKKITEVTFQMANPYVNEQSIYKRHTKWSALRAVDFFAEMVNTSDTCKQSIKKLSNKHTGKYYFRGEDDTYFFFENVSTGVNYNVLKDSYGSTEGINNGKVFDVSFIKWNNEWHISGSSITTDDDEGKLKEWKFKNQHLLYDYDEGYRQKVLDMQKDNYSDFMESFNEDLVFFKSYDELNQKIKDYYNYINTKRAKEKSIGKKDIPEFTKDIDLPMPQRKLNDYCLFYNPDSGIEIAFHVKRFLQKLKDISGDAPREEDIFFVFDFIQSDSISAALILELKKRYDLSGIGALYQLRDFDVDNELDFLLRMHKPQDYADKNPNISLVDRGELPSS
ncbi:MAG: hypothetical protein DRJ05_04840 [Bacteroidetes bacterium]|nr:MAG: hypothetical protein DRJ05_04840 [Bacteroidota bacterium]